jgi:hypothetical protein
MHTRQLYSFLHPNGTRANQITTAYRPTYLQISRILDIYVFIGQLHAPSFDISSNGEQWRHVRRSEAVSVEQTDEIVTMDGTRCRHRRCCGRMLKDCDKLTLKAIATVGGIVWRWRVFVAASLAAYFIFLVVSVFNSVVDVDLYQLHERMKTAGGGVEKSWPPLPARSRDNTPVVCCTQSNIDSRPSSNKNTKSINGNGVTKQTISYRM